MVCAPYATLDSAFIEAGPTEAPDLVRIDNFRRGPYTDQFEPTTCVDFSFDQSAYLNGGTRSTFHLVPLDGATRSMARPTFYPKMTNPATISSRSSFQVTCLSRILLVVMLIRVFQLCTGRHHRREPSKRQPVGGHNPYYVDREP